MELYRQIVQSVDAIPDNAKFLMGADIGNLVHKHGDKVKDLKSLFGFRGLLKKRAAELRRLSPTNSRSCSGMPWTQARR